MKRKTLAWLLALAAGVAMAVACGDGPNPQEGQTCFNKGDSVSHGGVTLHCDGRPGRLVWQR